MTSRYRRGKIYKLLNSVTGDEFFGCTLSAVSQCKCTHVSAARNGKPGLLYTKMRETGVNAWEIHLLEHYPCKNRQELRVRLQHWVDKQQPMLNTPKQEDSDRDKFSIAFR